MRAQSYGERDTGFSLVLSPRTEFPSGIVAALRTTATYPCVGYDIRAMVVWTKDTATVMITGLRAPAPCAGGGAEANGTAFLGAIPDTAFLRIDYRGETDLYRMISAGKRIIASPLRSAFTRVSFAATQR
jgi:hypothetical protein